MTASNYFDAVFFRSKILGNFNFTKDKTNLALIVVARSKAESRNYKNLKCPNLPLPKK